MAEIVYIVTVTGPEWLSSNDRRHPLAKYRIAKQWKENAGWAVRAARIPRIETKVHITAVCLWPDNSRKRDPSNYQDTAKACVDGIRDQWLKPVANKDYAHVVRGVLVDDDSTHVDGPDMRGRVDVRVRQPTLELHITPQGDEQ